MKKIITITDELCSRVENLDFKPPVAYVYNPLDYAGEPHRKYILKYARKGVVLMVGMNPGPFGMAQTGLPFGDVTMAKEFLQINGHVLKPPAEHPKRPVDGFACTRKEVSGTRLWSFARDEFKSADNFFKKFYVANYCPLVFMGETGKNITPDRLPANEQRELFSICDSALLKTAIALNCKTVLGIGAFAQKVCQRALKDTDIKVEKILHPSPASPAANRGWAEQVKRQLNDLNLL
jgi:single-strand selective monofunctional uracil DNA glycosylase